MSNTPEPKPPARRRSFKRIILLTLLGALLGATAGFLLAGKPQYKSIGLIQIKPYLPGVFTNELNPIPMFDAYIDSQLAIIQNRRTIDIATQNPEWKALGRGLSDQAADDFQSHLNADRSGIIIQVTFSDTDPAASKIAVKSIIQAYQDIYNEANNGEEAQRLDILENLKNKYQADLKRLRDTIEQQYGAGVVESSYPFKLEELNQLEAQLQRGQLELRIIDGMQGAATQGAPSPATITLSDETPRQVISATQLRIRVNALANQISQLQSDLKEVSKRKAELDGLLAESTRVYEQLNAVKTRLQQVTIDNQLGGRLHIISDGNTSPSPAYGRIKKYTLFGLLLGTALSLPLALLIRRSPREPAA